MNTKDSGSVVNRILANNVRALRIAAGMSQLNLAEMLSVSYQQVHKYERGMNRIPAAFLPKLAERFGVTVSNLLGASIAVDPSRSRSALELLKLFNDMPVERRDDLLQYARQQTELLQRARQLKSQYARKA